MSEKIKAAALSSTKGLSRVQAERAAENAARNVNAYGQKEEGPSRWQERKEAKTQMYLKSTEKQVTLNPRKCQKCLQIGHWTYECTKQKPENPKSEIASFSYNLDYTKIEKKEKKFEKSAKTMKKQKSSKGENKKRKRKSLESSDSETDSENSRSRKKIKRRSRRH